MSTDEHDESESTAKRVLGASPLRRALDAWRGRGPWRDSDPVRREPGPPVKSITMAEALRQAEARERERADR